MHQAIKTPRRLTSPPPRQYARLMKQLEEQIAHLTRTVDELSDVIARQDKDLALLTHRVQMLIEREAERQSDTSDGIVLGDQRPPHY